MAKNTIHFILIFTGVVIMLLAFVIVPDSQPWYYEVLLFNLGFVISMIPKLLKFKERRPAKN